MLKKIFDYLFYSCRHTWEIHHSGKIVNNKDIAIGTFYHLRCSKCGEMKFKKVINMPPKKEKAQKAVWTLNNKEDFDMPEGAYGFTYR